MFRKILAKILAALNLYSENRLDFIGGGEALPAPLDPEEEKQLIKRLAEKDERAKNELIERNLRLVVYIAKKFDNTNIDIEDLISVGTIGLIKAVNSLDARWMRLKIAPARSMAAS